MPHGAFLMAATGVRSPGCHGKHVWVPPTWGMALALALGSTRPSDAVAESRVAVLPVNSRSTLPSPTRAHLRDTVERGLRRADVEIVGDDLVDDRLNGDACTSARCAAALVQALEATWVLRSTITVADSVYEVRLEAVDARGRALASTVARCEICGQREVTELVVDRSAALEAKVRLLQRQAPRLVLRSRPSGAEVFIDDRLVGRTPLEHEVEVGAHDVRVELRGHVDERRRITAVAGTQDTLSFTLMAEPPRDWRPWLGVGVASLSAGTAMVGTGAVLAAIDEREYQRQCNPDPLGNCSHRYDTMAGGIALLAGGGALVVTGVVALVMDRRARRPSRTSARRQAARGRAGHGLSFAF